jgi:imidazolonepropionase-like amidohydrolase|nr:MAG: amidohydrolase [Bacteroidota bacterium]
MYYCPLPTIPYIAFMNLSQLLSFFLIASLLISCGKQAEDQTSDTKAFTGATIFDGTGSDPILNGVIVVRDGRIVSVGPAETTDIPDGAERLDLSGKWVIPGLINAHGHVGNVRGLGLGHYSAENIQRQLELYAKYGITTVVSLGDDRDQAESFRAANDTSAGRSFARLYIAGDVVNGATPEAATTVVDKNVSMGVDFIKIRVDDNLGQSAKMSPDIYRPVIDRAHAHGMKLAAHMYYLADAKDLLRSGADFIAHSVRDTNVDSEFISLMKEKGVCYCPTLTRDLSTFVYETRPDFFDDPFFLQEADTVVLRMLEEPERQAQIRNSVSAQTYKRALETALSNLKILADSGVTIAFGTDSGMPARFQGYFEHIEMEMMADAGMTPKQVLLSATRDAAQCLDLKDVGTLTKDFWADFVVLNADPLENIRNCRQIHGVWIGGKRLDY